MPNWKKVITSGSDASLNSLVVTSGVTAAQVKTSQLYLYDPTILDYGSIFLNDNNYSFRNNSGDDVFLTNTSSLKWGTPGNLSEFLINGSGTKTYTLPSQSGTLALLTDILNPSGSITGSLQGTASYANTASYAPLYTPLTVYNNYTSSQNIISSSFDTRINNNSGSLNILSSSFSNISSSLLTYISQSRTLTIGSGSSAVDLSANRIFLNNVPNVDATNASNITSGTLADARLSSNVPKMVFNVLPAVDGSLLTNLNPASIATVIQTITATATINNSTTTLLVNPATVVSSLSITFCAAPYQTQIIRIVFGGTITSGNQVVTTLSILPNSGQSVVRVFPSVEAFAGDFLAFQYINTNWYQIN